MRDRCVIGSVSLHWSTAQHPSNIILRIKTVRIAMSHSVHITPGNFAKLKA